MPLINNINQLNERVEIGGFELSGKRGPNGQKLTEYVVVGSCWAYAKTQMMRDTESLMGTDLEDTITLVVRHNLPFEITAKHSIKWQGKTYSVVKINRDVGAKMWDVVYIKELSE